MCNSRRYLLGTHLRSAPEAKGLASADSSLRGAIKQPLINKRKKMHQETMRELGLRTQFYLSVPGRPGADRDKCINMNRDRKHRINLPR